MRLVDYDEFKWQLTHWYDNKGWAHQVDKIVFNLMELDEAMEKTPTVDPVKHGHWEVVDGTEPRRYGCSVCKRLSWTEDNYCSYCGCKMDEVETE